MSRRSGVERDGLGRSRNLHPAGQDRDAAYSWQPRGRETGRHLGERAGRGGGGGVVNARRQKARRLAGCRWASSLLGVLADPRQVAGAQVFQEKLVLCLVRRRLRNRRGRGRHVGERTGRVTNGLVSVQPGSDWKINCRNRKLKQRGERRIERRGGGGMGSHSRWRGGQGSARRQHPPQLVDCVAASDPCGVHRKGTGAGLREARSRPVHPLRDVWRQPLARG